MLALALVGMALLGIGFPMTIVGAVMALIHRRSFQAKRSLARTPVTPIASVQSGPAAICGKIVAGIEGTFAAPLSDARAVWLRLEAQSRMGSRNLLPSGWGTAVEAVHSVGFLIEDGSGTSAAVTPEGAQVIFPWKDGEALPVFEGAPADAHALFERYAPGPWREFQTSPIVIARRYREQFLSPGTEIVVVGIAQRRGGAAQAGREGDAPLIAFSNSAASPDLFITTGAKSLIEASASTPFGCALVACIVGLFATLLGAALMFG